MGFNGKGVEYVAHQLESARYRGILGINIGKNRDTPLENAADDYLIGFRKLWKFASYITINISSPNTQGLRDLQQADPLRSLLSTLKQEQKNIADTQKKYVPLVVKISPDLTDAELSDIANVLLEHKIDGVIATNTTIQREGVEHSSYANETGGLSGKPLHTRSVHIIKQLHTILKNHIPIIGLGGIMDETTAHETFAAGASLLQIYTGLIYEGPGLIKRLASINKG
jgi:dihydroorotate dehydrogenase